MGAKAMRPFVFASALLAFARGAPTAREPLFGQSGVPFGDTCTQKFCHCNCDVTYSYKFDISTCYPQEAIDQLVIQGATDIVMAMSTRSHDTAVLFTNVE